MGSNIKGKMSNLLQYRMRVTLNDGRQMVGQMLSFDKHMNIVLADCEEFRKVKKSGGAAAPGIASGTASIQEEVKRTLGLAIIRGANVVSVSVEGPPPADATARLGPLPGPPTVMATGPGISRPAGRGAPAGLTGPAAGVGGPGPGGYGPPGFAGGPPGGFPGAGGPPGFGRGGPPGGPPGFAGGPPGFGGGPPGFQPQGFQGPPGGGRGFPPGFGR